jgi:hypothetical protein
MLNARQYGWLSLMTLFTFIAFGGMPRRILMNARLSTIRYIQFIFRISCLNCADYLYSTYYPLDMFPLLNCQMNSWNCGWEFVLPAMGHPSDFPDVWFTVRRDVYPRQHFMFDPNYDNWRRRVDSK